MFFFFFFSSSHFCLFLYLFKFSSVNYHQLLCLSPSALHLPESSLHSFHNHQLSSITSSFVTPAPDIRTHTVWARLRLWLHHMRILSGPLTFLCLPSSSCNLLSWTCYPHCARLQTCKRKSCQLSVSLLMFITHLRLTILQVAINTSKKYFNEPFKQ